MFLSKKNPMQTHSFITDTYLNDGFFATLTASGLLEEKELFRLKNQAKTENTSLTRLLIQQKKMTAKILAEKLAGHLQLPFFDLSQHPPTEEAQTILDDTFIRQHRVLPLCIQHTQLYVAISEPADIEHMKEVKFHTDLQVSPVVVESDKLMRAVDSWLQASQYRLASQRESFAQDDAYVIAWVTQMLEDALCKGASDIHIEPYKTAHRIRFRLDGILHKVTLLPAEIGQRIVARLKVMARLDMAERRMPQDGRFTIDLTAAESKDCRVSVCPTLFGEKIVIRILDAGKISLAIADLGLEKTQQTLFLHAIQKPQGMILVTGPTGSGKTRTLYAALHFLNTLEKNICTVEDPVEITLPGINQVPVDTKIQRSFAQVLRSFLRQDPDILMVGEIRDQETAETAIKAAHTGHLVFSTLHTNGAVETLTRLAMLGVSPFHIAHSVQLILAQRLVRQLCVHCKRLGADSSSYEAVGCDACTQGYKGRIAVFECLPISPEIAGLVAQKKSEQEIVSAAKNAGMMQLEEAAWEKVRTGITTIEEVQRVVGGCL
jgi:type IV pilus assembly protein PilB